jgi:PKD repeat protein
MRINSITLSATNVLLLVVLMLTSSLAVGLEVHMPGSQGGIHTVKPGGQLAKLDGSLLKVYFEFKHHQQTSPGSSFRPRNSFLRISRGRILIDAHAVSNSKILLADLNHLGLFEGSRFGNVVSGWLPIGVLRQAASLGSLRALSASIPITNAGSVTSQGDAAQRSDIARTLGVTGTGVKVGVLSDSYNQQGGAAADVASGDLPPAGVQVLDDTADCGDIYSGSQPCPDEGRAMLQIVHDVAPGADLAFHTANNGFAGFANGIVDLANAGARVITDDVIYLGEPMFMDGVIAQAVDQVKGMGVAYFSAAGNEARNSYEHAFVNSGDQLYIDIGGFLYPAGYMHDFDPGPGVDVMQAHTIPAGQCAIISVQWDSPFGSAALGTGTQNDLDIWLLDNSEQTLVAWDAHENIPTGEPVEAMQFCNDGLYVPTDPPVFKLIIALWEGSEPGLMKSVLFGNASIDEHATHSGTLYGHANAAGAEAVGAAYYLDTPQFGTSPPQLESYSSAGGTPILFTSGGTRLASPIIRMKPEIVAPDGVDTTFFYPASDRNSNGIPDFSGTSAATPHAAGVAALMLESNSTATPDAVQTVLESTAFDMRTAGFDYDSGYGLIQADQAVAAIDGVTTNLAPNADFAWSATDLSVQFTDQSSDEDGMIVGRSWDFGDDNSSDAQNPSHSYAIAGTYTVSLTVTDDGGAQDTTSKTVTVSAPVSNTSPVASFSYSCNRLDCAFDGSSSTDDGTIVSYSWTYGDGNTGYGINTGYTYDAAGTYSVSLTVTDDEGGTGNVTVQVQVKDKGKTSGSSDSGAGGSSGGGSTCPPGKAAKGVC